MEKVRDSSYIAWRRYRPPTRNGKIKFVRAAVASYFPEDPVAVWADSTDELDVETIPGNHVEMLTTYFNELATLLSRYLKDASLLGSS
jgi:thioesterase domain-containing protein